MANKNTNYNNNERKWMTPSKRAEGYAKERKTMVHARGPKKDEPLDDYNKGFRSGYLLAQSDHAGAYKYHKAIADGKTKQEARAISKKKGA